MSGGVGVDPRLDERRRAVQVAKGMHRLRVALAVLSIPAAVGAGLLLLRSAIFDVDVVVVTGARRVSVTEVRHAAAVEPGTPLAFVDTGSVAARVEHLPWIADARVSRDWPGTLRVEVEEHRPVAFIRSASGGAVLVAADGSVLGEAEEAPRGAVEITGVRRLPSAGDVLAPAGAAGVVGALPDALAARVGSIDLGENGVGVTLIFGPEIVLGTLDDVAAKGAAAQAVLERLGDDAVDYIDVSVPGAPVAGTADGGGIPALDSPVTADAAPDDGGAEAITADGSEPQGR